MPLVLSSCALFVVFLAFTKACNFGYHQVPIDHPHDVFLPEDRDILPGHPNWSDCPQSQMCRIGTQQSPIHLSTGGTEPSLSGPLTFGRGELKNLEIKWTGVNQLFVPIWVPGHPSTVNYSGVEYNMIQYHLHVPSEHIIDGKVSQVEIHLVHQNAETGNLAVVGFLVEEGNDLEFSPFLETMIVSNVTSSEEQSLLKGEESLNPLRILSELSSHAFFHYAGSLTTPPCSEGVSWFVMKESIKATREQIHRLKSYQKFNSRPVQEVGERTVFFFEENKESSSFFNYLGLDSSLIF